MSGFMISKLNIKAYGIGVVSDFIDNEFEFTFKNSIFKFLPSASRSYGLLPAGLANEVETHLFLENILNFSIKPVIFVDVGASIGEFVITMADDPRVEKVYAFEPHPSTFFALNASAKRLQDKIKLFDVAVGETDGTIEFSASETSPMGAGLGVVNSASNIRVPLCRIDEKLKTIAHSPIVILMDIEGGELAAMRGGVEFITERQPLIIFEYNLVSKNHFTLEQIRLLLDGYRFYRLQSFTGKLDSILDDTWNIVAIPSKGHWSNLSEFKAIFA
jgi:FkbM family methyltransferase